MEEKNTCTNNENAISPQPAGSAPAKKKSKFSFTWIVVIFVALMLFNFVRPRPNPQVNWLDYETGIKTAKQQNKPILIAFYKKGHPFCEKMWADTYANQEMIDFIEDNFVPVFVDVDEQPALAKEYDVTYFPLHVFKTSDNKQILKTRRGYDTPSQFSPVLNQVLEKTKAASS